MEDDHSLGIFSSMITLEASRDFIIRKCQVCGQEEKLPRAGKIWTGYSVQAEQFRDFERREFAKEHLQPQKQKYDEGPINELFEDAYGDPAITAKSKMGAKTDEAFIKPEGWMEEPKSKQTISSETRKKINKKKK